MAEPGSRESPTNYYHTEDKEDREERGHKKSFFRKKGTVASLSSVIRKAPSVQVINTIYKPQLKFTLFSIRLKLSTSFMSYAIIDTFAPQLTVVLVCQSMLDADGDESPPGPSPASTIRRKNRHSTRAAEEPRTRRVSRFGESRDISPWGAASDVTGRGRGEGTGDEFQLGFQRLAWQHESGGNDAVPQYTAAMRHSIRQAESSVDWMGHTSQPGPAPQIPDCGGSLSR